MTTASKFAAARMSLRGADTNTLQSRIPTKPPYKIMRPGHESLKRSSSRIRFFPSVNLALGAAKEGSPGENCASEDQNSGVICCAHPEIKMEILVRKDQPMEVAKASSRLR